MGGFILIDRLTNATVGAGLLHFALRRVAEHPLAGARRRQAARAPRSRASSPCVRVVHRAVRRRQVDDRQPASRSGCTPLGAHTYLLDGDNVRHGLNKDLGFTDADRVENIRRVAEVAKLMVDAGLIVLVSFISPFRAERRMARELLGEGEFVEVFVDTPLDGRRGARPEGPLRARPARGELTNFTGIDSPYEAPENPEIRIDTTGTVTAEQAAEEVVEHLRRAGILSPPTPHTHAEHLTRPTLPAPSRSGLPCAPPAVRNACQNGS